MAGTAWPLREKMVVMLDGANRAANVDLAGDGVDDWNDATGHCLRGGDFSECNSVKAPDHSIMKTCWMVSTAAEINGDGFTRIVDYGCIRKATCSRPEIRSSRGRQCR
jgi:hypothetical protein